MIWVSKRVSFCSTFMKFVFLALQLLIVSSVYSQSRLQFLATGTLSPLFEPMIESDQLGFHTSSEYEHKAEVLELVNRRPREGEERQFNKTLPFNSGLEINLWFNAEAKKKWIFGLSMMLSSMYKSELINIYSASSMGTQYSLSTRHTYQGVYLGAGVVLSKPLRFSERSILSTTSGFRYHKKIYSEAVCVSSVLCVCVWLENMCGGSVCVSVCHTSSGGRASVDVVRGANSPHLSDANARK